MTSTPTTHSPLTPSRYTAGAIVLHWTIALLIVVQLAGGYAMAEILDESSALQFNLYQLHKSLGILILMLTFARILWRVFNPPPPEPPSVSRLKATASHLVHMAFYGLLVLIPLSGWVLITVSPVQLETVLFFVDGLPWPHLPGLGALPDQMRAELTEASEWVHLVLAYAMLGLLALHVAGALKHQLADGAFVRRMTFGGRARASHRTRGALVTLLLTATVFGAIVVATTFARDAAQTLAEPSAPEPAAAVGQDAAAVRSPGGADNDGARWTMDPAANTLTYTVRYAGADVAGAFSRFDGDIVFDPDALETASIDVRIDTTSATIDSSEISLQNLAGSDGFDNGTYGTARFVSQTIRAASAEEGGGYVAQGTLEIRGESVPQQLNFDVTIDGDRADASGSLTLDRLAYGIGASNDATGDFIAKAVRVDLAIVAFRGPGDAPVETADTAPQSQPAELELWQVVAEESAVRYAFRYENDRVTGELPAVAADIRFDEDNLAASSIDATIDLGTLTADSGGLSRSQLIGADGLWVSAHPTAHFSASTVERGADGGFVARGTLMVRGVSQPIALPFRLEESEGRVRALGTVALDRRAYGFAEDANLSDDAIDPAVEVTIEIVALRPAAEAADR